MAVLKEFNLAHSSTIRRLAEGIALWIAGCHRSRNNEVIRSFNQAERAEFSRIIGQTELDETFRALVQELVIGRHRSDVAVTRLAARIVRYLESGGIEPSAGVTGTVQPGVVSSRLPRVSSGTGRRRTRPNTRHQSGDKGQVNTDEQIAIQLQEEEYEPEQNEEGSDGPSSDVAEGSGVTFLENENDPSTEIIWDPATMTRNSATPGVPQPSFYKIVIPQRKKAMNASGGHDPAPTLKFDWLEDHDEPDWSSVKVGSDLYKMNQWRLQIWRKFLGRKEATKSNWLAAEQQLIVDLLKQQLDDPDKPPQSKPKWRRLTNDYNRAIWKSHQPKGSRLVQGGAKKNALTDADRPAPWRTSAAIKSIVGKDTWKHVIDPILEAAEERRRRYLAEHELPADYNSDVSKDDREFPQDKAPKTAEQSKASTNARENARKAERGPSRRGKKAVVVLEPSSEDEDEDNDEEMEEEEEEEEPPRKKRKRDYGASRLSQNRRAADRVSDNDEGKVAPIRRDR